MIQMLLEHRLGLLKTVGCGLVILSQIIKVALLLACGRGLILLYRS